MDGWNPTTVYDLIGLGTTGGIGPAIDKQLARFQIASGRTDPQLVQKLSLADPALLAFLADRLALALFNQP